MELLRAATEEEVKKIAANSDLGPGCLVIALDTPEGTIFGVTRLCWELDPVHYPKDTNTRWKVIFLRDASHYLIGKSAPSFYFNLHADDASKEYREVAKHWGAEQVSTAPELRFKKNLL